MPLIKWITDNIKLLVTEPVEELTRVQRSIRYGIDLSRHCARQLWRDNAFQMAAALSFRTLFSLIPVLVLSLVLLRAFGGLDTVGADIRERAIRYWGLYALSYEPQVQTEVEVEASRLARENIGQMINDVISRIMGLDFASIGAVGIILLIYAALALAIETEDSFNVIFNAPRSRSWHRRITTYWSILTLAPVLLLVSFYVAGAVSGWLISHVGGIGVLLGQLSRFGALGASWLLLFLIYLLLPNTRVNMRAAAIGGFVAAVLWELGKVSFQLYVSRTLPYAAIYGTLGLIPLFLFWVYITWLIVLFGAELTYSLQTVRGRRLDKEPATERQMLLDARWIVPMMVLVGRSFSEGKAPSQQDLAAAMRLPILVVEHLGRTLQEAGLVHRLQTKEREEYTYSLARPPDQIELAKLLDLARSATVGNIDQRRGSDPAWQWMNRLRHAEQDAARDMTLRDLIDESKPG